MGKCLLVLRDLNPLRTTELPRSWPPQVAVLLAAVVVGVAAGAVVGQPSALVVGALQGLALVLCLYRPMAGFWLSLIVSMLVSELARDGGADPVWSGPSVLAHLSVLGLAGWRSRPGVLVVMWSLTLLGGAILAQRMPPGYDEDDLLAMTVLSAAVLIAAGAVRGMGQARRRLVEQERLTASEQDRRAVLEERSRIARELHDVLAHHMSVIAIQAEAAPHRVAAAPEPLTTSFTTIGTHARDALTELRRVLGVLRADGMALEPQPTLRDLPDLASAGQSVTIVGTPRPLPPGVEVSAYRILQEALNNTMRHAPGAPVWVEIDYRPHELRLSVRNGPGAATVSSGTGHGVRGMRERVEMLRGELTVGPTEDGGHLVAAVLPVSR